MSVTVMHEMCLWLTDLSVKLIQVTLAHSWLRHNSLQVLYIFLLRLQLFGYLLINKVRVYLYLLLKLVK